MIIDDIEAMLKKSQPYLNGHYADLLEYAIEIYRSIRLDDTDINKTNGDILLFRRRTIRSGSDPHFQVFLTISCALYLDDQDDELFTTRNLNINFRYPRCAETDGFGKVNMACGLKDVTDFLARITSSKVFEWVKNHQPTSVCISRD